MLDNRKALVDLIDAASRIPEMKDCRSNNAGGYRKAIELIVSLAEDETVTIDQIEEALGYEVF
jgi:hypothetical protein